jgi:hypothetical protein
LGILGDIFGQELQSDKAVQPYILGFINDTHPPEAQLLNDAGMGDVWPIIGLKS